MVRLAVRNRKGEAFVEEWICDAAVHVADAPFAGDASLVITGYTREPCLLQGKEDPLRPELCEIRTGALEATNRADKLQGFASYLAERKKAAIATASEDVRLVLLPPESSEVAGIRVVLYRRPSKFSTHEKPWEAEEETRPSKKLRRVDPRRRPQPRQQRVEAVDRPRGVSPDYGAVDEAGYVWRRSPEARNGTLPPCVYFQDHRRRYLFECGEEGLRLLEALVEANTPLLDQNERLLRETGEYERVAQDGRRIYADKNSLASKGITWTHEEYGHAGMQRVYLGTKCWQRFTETYNLLDRGSPELKFVLSALQTNGETTIRAASLGGGPGFELFALRKWLDRSFPDMQGELHSLDLQAEWKPYAEGLGLGFVGPWDITSGDLLRDLKMQDGDLHLVIISYVLIYCCTAETADMLARLLTPVEDGGKGVKALLVSERAHEQPMIAMLQERGIPAVRLMRQDNAREGTDERQLLFLSKNCDMARMLHSGDRERFTTFQNVPFMRGT